MGFELRRGEGSKGPSDRVELTARDADFIALFPSLWTFVTADKWPEDGKPRLTASITFFVEDGGLKAWLNDRAQGRGCCVTGASCGQLLDRLEAGLVEGTLDWRRNKGQRR